MAVAGPARAEVAARVRQAIERCATLEGRSSEASPTVSRAASIQTCREILDGAYDRVPEQAFYFTGGIDEVLAKAKRI